MMPAIINTITMVLLALLFSVPFGIGAAIYLVEYAKKGNKLVELVRITAETLTGIPSIIYGLFGMLFFVTALHWGYSMLAGAATLGCTLCAVLEHGERGKQRERQECPAPCLEHSFFYPKHLYMKGKYNSLFALDKHLLDEPEQLKRELGIKWNRLVVNLL